MYLDINVLESSVPGFLYLGWVWFYQTGTFTSGGKDYIPTVRAGDAERTILEEAMHMWDFPKIRSPIL